MSKRIIVLGIEGFNPDLVELWSEELVNLKQMQSDGLSGRIKSTVPPVSPVSWTCVQTGKNPGAFGFWDYQYRDDYSYGHPKTVSSSMLQAQAESIFHLLTRRARKLAVVSFPVSSPPPRIPGGFAVSCQMHQGDEGEYTWPKIFKNEVEKLVGEYIFDVISPGDHFDSIEKDTILEKAKKMDEQRFQIIDLLIDKKFCDSVFAVFLGADRISQVFYRYFDQNHSRYEDNPKYKDAIKNHYRYLDQKIGEIRNSLDDNAILLVLSNQGAQRLDGSINLNEWLLKEGFLTVVEYPSKPVGLTDLKVDWAKTRAWSAGNNGQIYLNMKGREAFGTVDPSERESLLEEISKKIMGLSDYKSQPIQVQLFKGDDLYTGPSAAYGPDLVVMFNGGCWNTSEKVGYEKISLQPDQQSLYYGGYGLEGYFCLIGPGISASGKSNGEHYLVDVAPTLLTQIDEQVPETMEGNPIVSIDQSEIEKKVRARLKSMGY
jgi:predicted AlkP superfamily phosphohydrolase/phosphomutase